VHIEGIRIFDLLLFHDTHLLCCFIQHIGRNVLWYICLQQGYKQVGCFQCHQFCKSMSWIIEMLCMVCKLKDWYILFVVIPSHSSTLLFHTSHRPWCLLTQKNLTKTFAPGRSKLVLISIFFVLMVLLAETVAGISDEVQNLYKFVYV
jgi:hypothetical protein